jgi:hypothetical protein
MKNSDILRAAVEEQARREAEERAEQAESWKAKRKKLTGMVAAFEVWTEPEVSRLRELFPIMPLKVLSRLLERSPKAISLKAERIGVRRCTDPAEWQRFAKAATS